METSPSIAALAASLSKAQASIEGAVKGKVNPAFKSKYADLSSVWEACREALTDNGLSVVQSPGPVADGRMELTTMLLHASGEWMRGTLTIPLGKVDAQAYGSATTYARRYALAAFVGVAPEDDDGNAATAAKPEALRPEPKQAPTAPPTLAERADRLATTLIGLKTAEEVRKAYGRASRLCADLDASDPERLAEIEALYSTRLADLEERKAA
tara:strand:+ start:33 stop:671 length:639 start_codon:yes stop_codon:yes gene_type:complete